MNRDKLRGGLIKLMLGCLVLAAAIAVVTILIGEFNDISARAIGTVAAALLHIGIVFGVVTTSASTGGAVKKSTDIVINAVTGIAILSFLTSILGIWSILSGDVAGKLYMTYIVALFVLLHGKSLMDVHAVLAKVKPYVYANYGFMAVVAALILGAVYSQDASDLLSSFYGRALAASVIIDVTISIIISVMHRLYIQQHPELMAKNVNHQTSGVRVVLSVLVFLFVAWLLAGFII